MTELSKSFLGWYDDLKKCARREGLEWIVAADPAVHLASFEAGRTPEEELDGFRDLCEWRGCGCSGGS